MKYEILSTFITARALFEKASELCILDDKHLASAGLVILQDAIELVLYACLKELEVDEEKSIENFTFDQLVGEIKKKGYPIPKSDTLKALNKQRVIIKHYGQIADPFTVLNYFQSARYSVDSVMQAIVGKTLQDILMHEVIRKEEIKECIARASQFVEERKYFEVLVEIRKAIFLEIEQDYSVFDWRDHPRDKQVGFLEMIGKGGTKAPWHTRNKEWIDENIRKPFDFIQLDHEKIRVDLLEWGVSTVDFWNLWRLTPQVFYDKDEKAWRVNLDLQHYRGGATEENARYCLDRAVSLLVRKQNHFDLTRQLGYGPEYNFKIRMKDDASLYSKASSTSVEKYILKKDNIYLADAIVPGLGGSDDFIQIIHTQESAPKYLFGYVNYNACDILEE